MSKEREVMNEVRKGGKEQKFKKVRKEAQTMRRKGMVFPLRGLCPVLWGERDSSRGRIGE